MQISLFGVVEKITKYVKDSSQYVGKLNVWRVEKSVFEYRGGVTRRE